METAAEGPENTSLGKEADSSLEALVSNENVTERDHIVTDVGISPIDSATGSYKLIESLNRIHHENLYKVLVVDTGEKGYETLLEEVDDNVEILLI